MQGYIKGRLEVIDRQIFNMFDLHNNGKISDHELCQLMLTMPSQAIVSQLNAEYYEEGPLNLIDNAQQAKSNLKDQ